jgi:uncharacterized protein YeaO (DUF488 family)
VGTHAEVIVLKTKSVHAPIAPADGLRLLVTRFRGRGLAANRYAVWIASFGPSEVLLRQLRSGAISWGDFRNAYRQEMLMSGPIDARNRTIKNHGQKFSLRLVKQLARSGNVTLLCHCPETEHRCHRHLLRALILSAKI